jgi:nitroimidazol reductase NimA-like FMN-containing flavoprotein (pyridoxamine 5'-phosphate oxidase superfamily)
MEAGTRNLDAPGLGARMSTEPERSSLEEIPREECLKLLGSFPVGRLAVGLPGAPPLVVPVNYVLDGEIVVFRSDPGEKIFQLRGSAVSFQIDQIDPSRRTGWSVLVQGVAYEATPAEVGHLHVEPWAPGEKSHWVRIVPASITGRRIRLLEIGRNDKGYL